MLFPGASTGHSRFSLPWDFENKKQIITTLTMEPYLKILNKDKADHNLSSSDLALNA